MDRMDGFEFMVCLKDFTFLPDLISFADLKIALTKTENR
jgi:hypothetical protein